VRCINMLRRNWGAMLACGALAWSQEVLVRPALAQPPPGQPAGGQSSSSKSSSGQAGAGQRGPRGTDSADGPISGRVVLSDGADPQGIAVQQVCRRTVTAVTYTDSSGHFTIPRGTNSGFGMDASVSANNSGIVSGCELRATLAGYSADPTPSGGFDGVIVLRPVDAKRGLTVSATTLLAPKEARKFYEKGLEAIARNRPDEAQKDFGGAVQIYPRYAAAWLELGKVYEQRDHISQARNAYSKSIAADAEYLFPYERLYRLDVKESKWKEAAEASGKVLRLDPYEFPAAYYFNAVSNLNLENLDAAERSAREAAKLEGEQAEPRANYILGVILWRKGDLDGAVEKIQTFLTSPSDGPEWESARKMLADIEKQIARRQARTGK
jgi:tetratricopeptide (TPR) repeat protein